MSICGLEALGSPIIRGSMEFRCPHFPSFELDLGQEQSKASRVALTPVATELTEFRRIGSILGLVTHFVQEKLYQ